MQVITNSNKLEYNMSTHLSMCRKKKVLGWQKSGGDRGEKWGHSIKKGI